MKNFPALLTCIILFFSGFANANATSPKANTEAKESSQATFVARPLDFTTAQGNLSLGIYYDPNNDEHNPHNGSIPPEAEILEDLLILTEGGKKAWNVIRMHFSYKPHERVLKVIEENQLPIKVVVGAWITGGQTDEQNTQQVKAVIRFAKTYPDIVIGITLGHHLFVDWSYHKFPLELIEKYLTWLKQIRAEVTVPVSLADDFNFWNKPVSKKLSAEMDFIMLNISPMYNSKHRDSAMDWIKNAYQTVVEMHPGKLIVLDQGGLASSSTYVGDEKQIKVDASEKSQAIHYEKYEKWVLQNGIPSIYYSAFDESWKGGSDPKTIYKNWGLFNSDRTPKKVMQPYFP